jgi:hypothetical protein
LRRWYHVFVWSMCVVTTIYTLSTGAHLDRSVFQRPRCFVGYLIFFWGVSVAVAISSHSRAVDHVGCVRAPHLCARRARLVFVDAACGGRSHVRRGAPCPHDTYYVEAWCARRVRVRCAATCLQRQPLPTSPPPQRSSSVSSFSNAHCIGCDGFTPLCIHSRCSRARVACVRVW